MSCLKEVHQYHLFHPEYAQREGLERSKGFQSYDDINKTASPSKIWSVCDSLPPGA